MTTALIRFANILLAAMLAGTSFGIWMGFDPSTYSPSTYIEQQKNLVLSINTLMVSLVVAATMVSATSAYLHRRNKRVFIALLIAAVSFGSCLLISRFGNLPLQEEMLKWSADSLPGNWTLLRDEWWSYHIMRTLAELVALVTVAWASVQPDPEGAP